MRKDSRKSHTKYNIRYTKYHSSGVTTLLVVVFMGIFALLLGSISSFVFEQAKYGRALYAREQALHISEAGLEYYKWSLAHDIFALTSSVAKTYTVNDPEGGALGSATVTPSPSLECGVAQWVDIVSKGTVNGNPTFPRTLSARYMQPSASGYSYLLNSNVLAGADRQITGPYFSNGGIDMDGTNNSDVLSPVSSWNCDSANYNCNPSQPAAPGVVTTNPGSGTGSALWKWGTAVSSVDFGAVSVDLSNLKTYAQTNGGVYFAPTSGSANQRGYHLIFNSSGTVTVKTVSATTGVRSYNTDPTDTGTRDKYSFSTEYSIISTESAGTTYAIPASCSVIFVEDHAWIEGVVKGKVTVAVGTPSDNSTSPSAYLSNNITYATHDGTSGLTILAEGNVLIPLNSPDTMEIHGIFVAENGHYGRNYYTSDSSWKSVGDTVPTAYNSYVLRTKLTTVGSVVSNQRTGTAWGNPTNSGFLTRVDAYDQLLQFSPPPFTPIAGSNYQFALWHEQ